VQQANDVFIALAIQATPMCTVGMFGANALNFGFSHFRECPRMLNGPSGSRLCRTASTDAKRSLGCRHSLVT
jgi:hypothetical protein